MKLGFSVGISKKGKKGIASVPSPSFPDFGVNLIHKDSLGYGRVFQDVAATIPVALPGDPVGHVVDYGDANYDAIQSVASKRPVMLTDAHGRFYLKHDRIDDYLTISSLPSGVYTWGISAWNGVQVFELRQPVTGEFQFNSADTNSRVLVSGSISVQDKTDLRTWLESRRNASGNTDVLRLNCGSNSVNLAVTESSASNSSWELGDGQTATGTSLVKTIVAPQTLVYKTNQPGKITQISWSNKGLFGLVDLSKLVNLEILYLATNGFAGQLDLTTNTKLQTLYASNNAFCGYINVSTNTLLQTLQLGNNQFSGTLNFSTNVNLQSCGVAYNRLTGFAGTVSNGLGEFYANNNLFSQAVIDSILLAFVNANRTTGTRILNIGGTGNAAPSVTGLGYKTTLTGRGWTVTHN